MPCGLGHSEICDWKRVLIIHCYALVCLIMQYMPHPHVTSVASGGSVDDCRRRVHAVFEEPFSL